MSVNLVVAMATARYGSAVKHITEHIPVVIFVNSRLVSVMFARSSVFPREDFRYIIGSCRTHIRYFEVLM